MSYSIVTKDGITIDNIPDEIASDSQELKDRVSAERQKRGMTAPEPVMAQEPSTFLQSAMPEIARPEFRQELGRQLALTGRTVPAAASSLLGIVGDPLNALVNMITGSRLGTIRGSTEQLMTQAGVPEPRPGLERGIYDVTTAGMTAAGPGGLATRFARTPTPAMPRIEPTLAAQAPAAVTRAFTEAPGLQATGAIGGTLASQLAAQAGAGPLGQAASALAGGVLAPGALSVTGQRAFTGGREVARPFTQEGREVISGNVLRSLSADPDLAAMRAGQYEARVPGYQPTTAQATRDVGLVSAEPVIRSMDTTGRFVTQQSGANAARTAILDRLAKDKSVLEQAITKRDEVTTPLREAAFARATVDPETFQSSVTLTVNKTIDDILASDAGARGTVRKAMEWAKGQVGEGTSPARLYEVRKDLRDAAIGLLDKEGAAYSLAGGQLRQVIKAVDDVIEASAPGYRDYLQKYAKASKGIESLEAAQAFRGKVFTTTPDPLTGEYLISQPSFTRAIREIEKGGFKGLSQTQIASLKRVSKDLDDGVLARAAKAPGSDTFKNISTANVIGGIIGKQIFGETSPLLNKVAAPLNWLYNGTDDAIRNLLVEAMLDPKLASQLMAKASVVRIEPISQELQRKAISLGYGSAFGLTE